MNLWRITYASPQVSVPVTQSVGTTHAPDVRDAHRVHRWRVVGPLVLALMLTGCATRGGAPDIGITTHHDFSEMVPALVFFCVIGIAASIAALIWIPIQKWIPLAALTFFASCIVVAWTVEWLTVWMPWIIGGGMCIGLLWSMPYLRNILLAIKRSWNEPQDAPNPPIIDKILKGK